MNVKQVMAERANTTDLTAMELGILPLSFLRKRPWYNGKLIRTKRLHRRICRAIAWHWLIESLFKASFCTTLSRENRFSNAMAARRVNIGEEEEGPNSMISL